MDDSDPQTEQSQRFAPFAKPFATPSEQTAIDTRVGDLYLFGQVPYAIAWQWQQQLVTEYKAYLNSAHSGAGSVLPKTGSQPETIQAKDALLLLQHNPVYTLGQGSDKQFLRFNPNKDGHELFRVERGGEVTYHCPGQLVGYPILNLRHYRQDLHWYLRQLEEVLIRTLARYGLKAERIEGLTGVWVEGYKLAAIGIKVSRWITMHGFALNVCPDLSGFEQIVPCGIEDRAVGSMAQFLLSEVAVETVRQVLIGEFEQVFGLSLQQATRADFCLD
ncbi:MAG: lipoyl(octanoyl) transferase LipB [Cyanobacteria bacterium J06626_6]